jgi:phospholipase/lecithinase/hemolysin
VCSLAASAQTFDKLVVFSSSLSDTGNYAALNGDRPAPYYKNRTTDGPVAVEVFAAKFGLTAEASMHVVGKSGGLNFATHQAAAYGTTPVDLAQQVQAYLGPRKEVADKQALYFVFIGARDVVHSVLEANEQKSDKLLNDSIAAVEAAIRRLHKAGARYFYSPNNVDLGILPVALMNKVGPRATAVTHRFNEKWERMLQSLERELGITAYRFDFFRFSRDVLAASPALGLTDITTPCLAQKEPSRCDPKHYAFLTELLPSARIHELLGNALAQAMIEQIAARAACKPGAACPTAAPSYATIVAPPRAD